MTVGHQTKTALDGLYKDIYGDKFETLVPDFGVLTKKIKFAKAKKLGRDYVQAVKLTNEHGFTYGENSALAAIISADVDDAKVRGAPFTLRTGFSYSAAAAMAEGGEEAFISGTKFKFMTMMEAATHRLEQQILYGSAGLSISDAAGITALTATTAKVEITRASWAPGLWAGARGAPLQFYTVGGAVQVGGALFTVVSIVPPATAALPYIVVSGASGDITTLVAADTVPLVTHWAGAFGNEMVGLRSQISNTGTLFGIDGSLYNLWQGNTKDLGATRLNLRRLYDSLVDPVSKGLMEDVVALVSPATWAGMANDQASLRRYNAVSKKADNGHESIEFYGPQGKIEIMIHPMIREQEAMVFPIDKAERIGSSDLTFKTPGNQGDEMFLQSPDRPGFEVRLFSEQAVFLPCPAKCVLITGIDNDSAT